MSWLLGGMILWEDYSSPGGLLGSVVTGGASSPPPSTSRSPTTVTRRRCIDVYISWSVSAGAALRSVGIPELGQGLILGPSSLVRMNACSPLQKGLNIRWSHRKVPSFTCTPMLAWARATASLVPSPQKMTTSWLSLIISWRYFCLSPGEQRDLALDGGMLSFVVIVCTAPSSSPLTIETVMPRETNEETTEVASGESLQGRKWHVQCGGSVYLTM